MVRLTIVYDDPGPPRSPWRLVALVVVVVAVLATVVLVRLV